VSRRRRARGRLTVWTRFARRGDVLRSTWTSASTARSACSALRIKGIIVSGACGLNAVRNRTVRAWHIDLRAVASRARDRRPLEDDPDGCPIDKWLRYDDLAIFR
jgi:hypothetical protein